MRSGTRCWNGSTGSITAGCRNRPAACRRRKGNRRIVDNWKSQPGRPDSDGSPENPAGSGPVAGWCQGDAVLQAARWKPVIPDVCATPCRARAVNDNVREAISAGNAITGNLPDPQETNPTLGDPPPTVTEACGCSPGAAGCCCWKEPCQDIVRVCNLGP